LFSVDQMVAKVTFSIHNYMLSKVVFKDPDMNTKSTFDDTNL